MPQLTRDQIDEVRLTVKSPGYQLIQWQQQQIMNSFGKSLDSAKDDHRFHQGRKDGAKAIINAPTMLIKKK